MFSRVDPKDVPRNLVTASKESARLALTNGHITPIRDKQGIKKNVIDSDNQKRKVYESCSIQTVHQYTISTLSNRMQDSPDQHNVHLHVKAVYMIVWICRIGAKNSRVDLPLELDGVYAAYSQRFIRSRQSKQVAAQVPLWTLRQGKSVCRSPSILDHPSFLFLLCIISPSSWGS
jgi:hypothetical protein